MPRWPFPRREFLRRAYREDSRRRWRNFEGIARRQEVRGEARGVKVIDDFGHHPTAIAQTLTALRHRYPGPSHLGRLRAALEHHAARRFPAALPDALSLADGVFISAGGAPGADPGSRATESAARSRRDREIRPARVLREKCGRNCRSHSFRWCNATMSSQCLVMADSIAFTKNLLERRIEAALAASDRPSERSRRHRDVPVLLGGTR